MNDSIVLSNINKQVANIINYANANKLVNNNVQQKILMCLEQVRTIVNEAQSTLQDSNRPYNFALAYNGETNQANNPAFFTNYPDYEYLPGVSSKQLQPITLSQIEAGATRADELISMPRDYLVMTTGDYNINYNPWGQEIVVQTPVEYSSTPANIVSKSFTPFATNKYR